MPVAVRLIPGPLTDGTEAFPFSVPRAGRLGELLYDNIVYSAEPGYRPLFLDLRLPTPRGDRHPLIIWIHGGGWIYGSRRRLPPHLFESSLFEQFLDAGYAVAAVDYRLAREAGLAGMLLDIKASIRWLRGHASDFNLDPERVVVWGESAGGHLAAMVAMCDKLGDAQRTGEHFDQPEQPNAVVDWYGPADLTAMSLLDLTADSEESGSTVENPAVVLHDCGSWTDAELSSTTYVRHDVPPIFVAHGADDQTVPATHSRELVGLLRHAGAAVGYLEVPGADHVWRGAPSVPAIVAESLDFITKALS